MRPLAHRTPLVAVTCLTLGLAALLVGHAPRAEAYNPLFKRPVMVVDDGLGWDGGKDANGHALRPGGRITAKLRLGNGIPGQAGYTSAHIRRRPQFASGPTQILGRPGDGAVSVRLPFPFPFGGLRERTASVSPSGWISFGGPASDDWKRVSGDDRGAAAVAGDFERGIMPFRTDVEAEEEGGGMKMVTPAGDRSVAFRWEAGQHRAFQLVLFRDGRFRFDYPGHDAPGGHKAFVGYSLGTGPSSLHRIGIDARAELKRSILVTPRSVKAAQTLPAGRTVLDLPSGFIPNLPPGCTFEEVGELIGDIEQVELKPVCPVVALKPGAEAVTTVSFKAPGAKGVARKGVSIPGTLGYSGAYTEGPRVLASDDDEVAPVRSDRHDHGPNWLSLMPFYSTNSPPVVGEWAEFGIAVSPHAGEVENATVSVKAPPSVANFQVSAYGTLCSPQNAEGTVSCTFTDAGLEYLSVTVRMRPQEANVGSPLTLPVSVTSPEFKSVSATTSSPPVVAAP